MPIMNNVDENWINHRGLNIALLLRFVEKKLITAILCNLKLILSVFSEFKMAISTWEILQSEVRVTRKWSYHSFAVIITLG